MVKECIGVVADVKEHLWDAGGLQDGLQRGAIRLGDGESTATKDLHRLDAPSAVVEAHLHDRD